MKLDYILLAALTIGIAGGCAKPQTVIIEKTDTVPVDLSGVGDDAPFNPTCDVDGDGTPDTDDAAQDACYEKDVTACNKQIAETTECETNACATGEAIQCLRDLSWQRVEAD